ncbi:MAG TPA: hypothetical protein VFS18_00035 [Actinomycetota bacterium]|nr:hypothetical protein [Actinomycetota bacterium]
MIKYLGLIAALLVVVVVFAGSGGRRLEAVRGILFVVAGVILLAAIFGVVLDRTL